jgi:hypothetical protein
MEVDHLATLAPMSRLTLARQVNQRLKTHKQLWNRCLVRVELAWVILTTKQTK